MNGRGGDFKAKDCAQIDEHSGLILVPRACVISGRLEERLLHADVIGQEASIESALVQTLRHVDPMVLWGAWPGDEPIEELLAELD